MKTGRLAQEGERIAVPPLQISMLVMFHFSGGFDKLLTVVLTICLFLTITFSIFASSLKEMLEEDIHNIIQVSCMMLMSKSHFCGNRGCPQHKVWGGTTSHRVPAF